jgi:hypothetical protein
MLPGEQHVVSTMNTGNVKEENVRSRPELHKTSLKIKRGKIAAVS